MKLLPKSGGEPGRAIKRYIRFRSVLLGAEPAEKQVAEQNEISDTLRNRLLAIRDEL